MAGSNLTFEDALKSTKAVREKLADAQAALRELDHWLPDQYVKLTALRNQIHTISHEIRAKDSDLK